MKIVTLDTETTGKDINEDRVVQLSLVKYETDKDAEELGFLLDPEMSIAPEATAVHGITNAMVFGAPKFRDVAQEILDFIEGYDLGGYNFKRFDLPLLMKEFQRVGLPFNIENRNLIDSYQIEGYINPRTLGHVYFQRTGKSLEGAHDAFADVEATNEVMLSQLKELGITDLSEMARIMDEEYPSVDLTGKLWRDENGFLRWTFGKNIDERIIDDVGYIKWFLSTNPAIDTVDHILNECKKHGV